MTVSSVALTRTGLQDFLTSEMGGPSRADLYEYGADVEKAIREAVEARKARYRLTFGRRCAVRSIISGEVTADVACRQCLCARVACSG